MNPITKQPESAPLDLKSNTEEFAQPFCHLSPIKYLCCALFCPCSLGCQIGQRLGEGTCSSYCCMGFNMAVAPTILRTHYKIKGSLANDAIKSSLCPICSMIQTMNELDYRGL
ncbi:hypothetical protein SNEBB_010352 [Seison nebaliae]|nr:hypothetical protein SNEBB_010352 [Seison nebaliae]